MIHDNTKPSFIALFACALCAVVTVPHSAKAAAGEGINVGDVNISPYVEIKGILDDNVRLDSSNEQDDTSVMATLGATASHATESVAIEAGVWGRLERYSDLGAEDHDDWGQAAKIRIGGADALNLTIDESSSSIEELDYGTGTIEARDLLSASAAIGKQLTDKLGVNATVGYSETAYDSDRLFDWEQTYSEIVAAHQLSDKSDGTLTARFTQQDSDSFVSEQDMVTVRAGLKTRGSDKLTGNVGVGVREHDQSDLSGFSFDVGGQWQASPQLTVAVEAGNSVEPVSETENNSKEVTSGSIQATYQIQDDLFATVTGSLRTDDYDQPVTVDGASVDREDDTLSGKVRLTYLPPQNFVQVFLEGEVRDRDSNANSRDFSQTVGSAGVSVTY